jgi:hypothetical protein
MREMGWGIERRPTADEPDHVVVIGTKTQGKRRRLARECLWVVPPPSMR